MPNTTSKGIQYAADADGLDIPVIFQGLADTTEAYGNGGFLTSVGTSLDGPWYSSRTAGWTTQVLTSSGTWTKPAGVQLVEVCLAGGGGGGASGPVYRSAGTSSGTGGQGGQQGAISLYVVDVRAVSSVSYTIGAGGAGGAAVTSAGAVTAQQFLGNPGSDGGRTVFGSVQVAGGPAGVLGSFPTDTASAPGGRAFWIWMRWGYPGQPGTTPTSPGGGMDEAWWPFGTVPNITGTNGGSTTNSTTSYAGGTAVPGRNGQGANGRNSSSGGTSFTSVRGGGASGAGAQNTTATGTVRGGDGGSPGANSGGGGGGGGSCSGNNTATGTFISGAGGAGGSGFIILRYKQ